MQENEILRLAIDKAEKNGFSAPLEFSLSIGAISTSLWREGDRFLTLESIIFSHDFAKAFFGIELFDLEEFQRVRHFVYTEKTPIYKWQCHLQLMVLEENPILYLQRFI